MRQALFQRFLLISILIFAVYIPIHAQIHVAPWGNKGAPGTPERPLLSIQDALQKAVDGDITEIRMAAGTFTVGKGLKAGNAITIPASRLKISGGWDKTFVQRDGRTTLDGGNKVNQMIAANKLRSITIDGFTITGCVSGDHESAAIFWDNIEDSIIRNCESVDNKTCGLFMRSASNNDISMELVRNRDPKTSWAAAFLSDCRYNQLDLRASFNKDGAVLSTRGVWNTFTGSYVENGSDRTSIGGGICLWESRNETIDATVQKNRARDGGGIYVFTNEDNAGIYLKGQISGNTATRSGGGISLNGDPRRRSGGIKVSARISDNIAQTQDGGGIAANDIRNSVFSGTLSANTAGNFGGGFKMKNGLANFFDVAVTNNSSWCFGGVDIECRTPTFTDTFSSNSNIETAPNRSGLQLATRDVCLVGDSKSITELSALYKPLFDAFGFTIALDTGLPEDASPALSAMFRHAALFFRNMDTTWFVQNKLELAISWRALRLPNGEPAALISKPHSIPLGLDSENDFENWFFHGLFHAMEGDLVDAQSLSIWNKYNPTPWVYGDMKNHRPAAFFNKYCCISASEDMAISFDASINYLIAETLGKSDKAITKQAILLKKIQFMESHIRSIMPTISDQTWVRDWQQMQARLRPVS